MTIAKKGCWKMTGEGMGRNGGRSRKGTNGRGAENDLEGNVIYL
jgi:hypothetical protein